MHVAPHNATRASNLLINWVPLVKLLDTVVVWLGIVLFILI